MAVAGKPAPPAIEPTLPKFVVVQDTNSKTIEMGFRMCKDQPLRYVQRLVRQVHDTGCSIHFLFRLGKDPTTPLQVDMPGFHSQRLLRPATTFPGRIQKISEFQVPNTTEITAIIEQLLLPVVASTAVACLSRLPTADGHGADLASAKAPSYSQSF